MPTRTRRNEKKRATRGASHPDGRGSRRHSERPINPLDLPDAKYGKNPRDLSRAVRRSVESTGMTSTGARGPEPTGTRRTGTAAAKVRRISKHDSTKKREKYLDAIDQVRDTHRSAGSGRKGGPGKRRPTPKKTRKS